MKPIIFIVLFLAISLPAYSIGSLDTILVEEKALNSANSIITITNEDIEKSKALTITEILNQVSGIFIQDKGGLGQNSLINLNGSKSYHIVILLDGVKMQDSSNIQPYFDIGQIPLSFIEEIEIIKGSSSVLYGSGAIAGVINIKTKKEKENYLSIKSSGGSFYSFNNQLGISTFYKDLDIKIYGSNIVSKGYSVVKYNDENAEKDGLKIKDYNLHTRYFFSKDSFLEFFYKRNISDVDIDNGFGPLDIGGETVYKKQELYYIKGNISIFNHLNNKLIFSGNETFRNYEGSFPFSYASKDYLWQYKGNYSFYNIDIQGGFDFETQDILLKEENSINDYDIFNTDAYFNIREDITENISLEQGFRVNNNNKINYLKEEKIDKNYAYNFAILTNISSLDTIFKLNYGQSFRNPSAYEMFSQWGGNESLLSEVSKGYNLEIINKYLENIYLNLFYNEVKNMIIYSSNWSYENSGIYTSYGADIATLFNIWKIDFNPSYTFNFAKDTETKKQAPLIPKHKININTALSLKHLDIIMESIFVSKTFDSAANINLAGYGVHNIIFSTSFKDQIEVYMKINNIFDKNYQTNYGYQTSPRAYYLGLNIDL